MSDLERQGIIEDYEQNIQRWQERVARLEDQRTFERGMFHKLRDALRALVDDEPCSFDHHGYCQVHGPGGIPCEMQVAHDALAGVACSMPSNWDEGAEVLRVTDRSALASLLDSGDWIGFAVKRQQESSHE